ncbi:MAG: hypothetical protein GY761_09750 [Hyphomicrobiales bacterium]|nr:hypothetical protein [Hyphomicrobiales bacterium]
MTPNVKINGNSAQTAIGVHLPLNAHKTCSEEKSLVPHGANQQKETYLHTIRRRCLGCAGTPREVTFCTTWDCALHPYRFGVRPGTFGKRLASKFSPNNEKAGGERHWKPDQPLIRTKPIGSPLKSIRAHCISCSGSSPGVADCGSGNCPLHILRFGKDPFRKKRQLTDQQKRQFREQMGHCVEVSCNG